MSRSLPTIFDSTKENAVEERIWTCKVGGIVAGDLASGLDAPMREAVERRFERCTGSPPAFTFSGWGGELTEPERAVVQDRLPHCPECGRNDFSAPCSTCNAVAVERPEGDPEVLIRVSMTPGAAEALQKALQRADARLDDADSEDHDWLAWGASRLYNALLDRRAEEL